MEDHEIEFLKLALKVGMVGWTPDNDTIKIVKCIGRRGEEDALTDDGDGGLCASFSDGNYVCLENCQLSDFATIKLLSLSLDL